MATPTQLDLQLIAVAPEVATPLPEIVAALRTIGDLDGLTEAEYTWIATHGTERVGPDGAIVFREGEIACQLNFILRGEIHVRRHSAGPMALFIGRAGQMTGKLPFSRMKTYGGDAYTVGPAWAFDVHQDLFPAMLAAIPSMGQRCVSVLLDRVREVTRMEQQAEKLAALGKLAANLAHELNNPASAAQRSAASLFNELRRFGDQKYRLGALCLNHEHTEGYQNWVQTAHSRMIHYTSLAKEVESPLAVSDREDSFTRWLEAHSVPEPWAIAPSLAETRIPVAFLDELAAVVPPDALPIAVSTIASGLRVERMSETILDSTVRIFDLISAIKDYSYMDQAPIQEIDLAQSLENTLTMFSARLHDVTIETEFDSHVPPISAYGSELKQVWTEIIENALDALQEPREDGRPLVLRLTTRLSGQMALVEIRDNGPGIPEHLQSRIFEPFFTTRAPGRGLGLGLDTAQRIVSLHSGFLNVKSEPGDTCFQVRLPIDQAQAY